MSVNHIPWPKDEPVPDTDENLALRLAMSQGLLALKAVTYELELRCMKDGTMDSNAASAIKRGADAIASMEAMK